MQNNTNKLTVWFIAGFLILVTAGVIIAGALSGGTSGTQTPAGFVVTTAPAITSADWKEGNLNSPVSLIEYGDFECPACGEYYPLVQQLLANYSSTVLFVFRNFPLYTIHPDAGIAAQAAEAAGLQGKYWQMNNLLYSKQTEWSTTDPSAVVSKFFNGYATSLGMNVSQFDTDINASSVTNKIQLDVTGGNGAQIDHTPTFFINLKQIPNPGSYDEFKADLDQAIASSTGGQ